MELLQLRENEIFKTLKGLKSADFVIIGGYAVNAYTLPRFSVDCDVVVKEKTVLQKIEKVLLKLDYLKIETPEAALSYYGDFFRFEKEIKENFRVSIDILFKEIMDRQTDAVLSADWVFQNSKIRRLKGKTIAEELNVRIIDVDALFVMKFLSCRSTDIRDLFMLVPHIKDKAWIKREISKHYDFNDRFFKLKKKITSPQFRNGLQGVFGFVNSNVFEKHKKLILIFED